MKRMKPLSRREFLKLAGINLAAFAFQALPPGMENWMEGWPLLGLQDLPGAVKEIVKRVPNTEIGQNGYLYLLNKYRFSLGRIPQAPTQWNYERRNKVDELFPNMRWGIVLHWYGDPAYFDRTVKGFLRGFNSIRHIDDFETQTSAHFLVGDRNPSLTIEDDEDMFGIIQTQVPSPKGVPYLASHLNNYVVRSFSGDQYFVNALYKLGIARKSINPVLQDLYEGPKVDPNFRTIAIEISGYEFDDPDHSPSTQQLANVLSVVWAVMKRYRIRAIDVLGHNEIQLTNSDPGKKFMALIRYMLGVMALLEGNAMMRYLVFGPFLNQEESPATAVNRYFKYVRDYLVLVGLPKNVFEWEALSKYWFMVDRLSDLKSSTFIMKEGHLPILGESTNPGSLFLDPDNHEGIDIYLAGSGNRLLKHTASAYLVTDGTCIHIGENRGFHHGRMAIFRHRQPIGSELLTVYGHLKALGDIEVDKYYPAGHHLGSVGGLEDGTHTFLHFSTAYGATWDKHLSQNPNVPLSANATWVHQHYIDPEEWLNKVVY